MDKDTFAARVMDKSEMLYRVARTLLRSEEDCRDALGCAVLRAWEKRHTLRDERLFDTWMTRIVINECYTMLRARKKQTRLLEAAAASTPQRAQTQALDALYTLPEGLRLPMVLHYVEGYPVKQIARMLRVPVSTVRGRLERGRKALRLELDMDEEDAR